MMQIRFLIAVSLFAWQTCFATPIYSVSVIQSPAGWSGITMYGINDSGQAVGTADYTTPGQCCVSYRAFIGTAFSSTPIPLSGDWSTTTGFAINDSGQVTGVGSSLGGAPNGQAVIGAASGITPIPLPGGWPSTAGPVGLAIDSSGQITGYGTNGTVDQAFVGTPSGSTPIPLPNGWTNSYGYAINSSGQVAGYVSNTSGNNQYNQSGDGQAFIGTESSITPIPLPTGWADAFGLAINDSGQVVGYGYSFSGDPFSQAFIGTASGSTAIPLPEGSNFVTISPDSLNDSGVVVGYSALGGWMWDAADGTVLLNAFVPTGWNITDAIAISNSGLILAEGSFNGGTIEYVELSQSGLSSPEPTTRFLGGAGLLLLVLRASWRKVRAAR